jgi:hypothetical protein
MRAVLMLRRTNWKINKLLMKLLEIFFDLF